MTRRTPVVRAFFTTGLLLACAAAQAQAVQNRTPFNNNNRPATLPATIPPPTQATQQAPRSYGAPPPAVTAPQATVDPRQLSLPRKLPTRTHCLADYISSGLSLTQAPTIQLRCNVPEQPTLMTFYYDNTQRSAIAQADKEGFTVWVDYQYPPAAEGNANSTPTILSVQQAYFSRVHVVCLPVGIRNALHLGPRGEGYEPITTFCTDGQKVTPVTFAPDSNSFKFLKSYVEDGPLAVDYHLVMGGRNPKTGIVSPYPIQRVYKLPPFPPPGNWLPDTKHSADAAIAGIATRCSNSSLIGAGAAGCFGRTYGVKVGNTTYPPKTSSTEYRTYFSESIARAQNVNVPVNHTKSVLYTLMPGVVPPEFRNATQGACRVALYSAVEVTPIPQAVGVGVGREDHPKDAYCRKLFNSEKAIWAYSMIRQEEMCFASPEHLKADHQQVADQQSAKQAEYTRQSEEKYGKPQLPPIGVDTCELLPR